LAERLGSRLNLRFAKAHLGLLVETGDDLYRGSTPGSSRIDKVFSYGATLGVQLRGFRVDFQTLFSDYDSNVDAFDRDVLTWGVSLQLGLVKKFALGRGDRLW
jgi:hypothetical protein